MNLKLGKSFPVLKFKPNVLEPLTLQIPTQDNAPISKNRPMLSFNDLINMDTYLNSLIRNTKNVSKSYIQSIKQQNVSEMIVLKKQLKVKFQHLLEILQKLQFENIQKSISELFKGPFGLYSLYRYVWSIDFLIVMARLRGYFEKDGKLYDPETEIYAKKGEMYYDEIQTMMQKDSKILLKQFMQEMYITPQNWGIKLAKKYSSDFDENTLQLILSQQNLEQKMRKILQIYSSSKCDDFLHFRSITKAFFYLEIQSQFCCYLTLLKSLLLNKSTGIFNGDYQTWELVYTISLKLYSRSPGSRFSITNPYGVQIDQIIQHQIQDVQFTNFIVNSKQGQISLGSLIFYLKNTNKTVRTTLKPILEQKIKEILKKGADGFNEYEDIFEFLSNQSKGAERDRIVHEIASSWLMMMEKGINEEQMFEIQKHLPDMIQFLIKNPEYFFKVISEKLLKTMKSILSQPKQQQQNSQAILLCYYFINTMLIQCYEEQFDFNFESLPDFEEQRENESSQHVKNKKQNYFTKFIKDIIVLLYEKHHLLVHEDAISIANQWGAREATDNSSQSDNESNSDKDEGAISRQDHSFCRIVAHLMIVSGRDCDFKLERFFKSQSKKQLIANQVTGLFKKLSDLLFEQRRQVQKLLKQKTNSPLHYHYLVRWLTIKGLKDKLLHENITNLASKLHPTICFAQLCLFAAEFLTFTSPTTIDELLALGDEPQNVTIQPFDVCDIISGQEPIQCMKLIYKKIKQIQDVLVDVQCLEKLPLEIIRELGSLRPDRSQLSGMMIDNQLGMGLIDRYQEFKKLFFYVELMNKVFNKLNEKSQKGIKQIKIIYAAMQKSCYKIWDAVRNRVISSEIYNLCKLNSEFQRKILQIQQKPNIQITQLKPQSLQLYQLTFSSLIKTVKLPYIDSILNQHYLTKTSQDLICSISRIITPNEFSQKYLKLFNPLEPILIDSFQSFEVKEEDRKEMRRNYEFIGQIVRFLGLIQFTCCHEEAERKKQEYQGWAQDWKKMARQMAASLLQKIEKHVKQFGKSGDSCEKNVKNLWINIFLVHLKAEVIKILIPHLIKQPLNNPVDNPKAYNTQLEEVFSIFSTLCQIIEMISPGQEEHLMTFLQIFENFDTNAMTKTQTHSKVSEFLYKSIQTLLELVFKGNRVRSYHFYKFIKSYLKHTKDKQNYLFFNSVIAHYIQTMMRQIVPNFNLSQSLLTACDDNMNNGLKAKGLNTLQQRSSQECMINEVNLKKNANRNRFAKFIRFQPKFQFKAQKICAISMFLNLFCRLNFKCLTEGIEKIWESPQMHLLYIEYLQKITELLSSEVGKADQKLFDIINIDCFGNLSIILRTPIQRINESKIKSHEKNQYSNKMIYQLLKLIHMVLRSNIRSKIQNSLAIPIKKMMSQIKSSATSSQTIDYICEVIQELNIFKGLHMSPNNVGDKEQKQSKVGQKGAQKKQENVNEDSDFCPLILDMVLTCYNIKLTRGISSNAHLNNLLYVTWDSELKSRVFQQNMGVLERRMARKDIRNALHKIQKAQQSSHKQKNRRSSITKKSQPTPANTQIASLPAPDTTISPHSLSLIRKIVQNFISTYKQTIIDKEGELQARSELLFSNLKTLTIVTLNNPQILPYLAQSQSQAGMSVYDVMVHAAKSNFIVFVELAVVFFKTNFGFSHVGTGSGQSQKLLVPNSFLTQQKLKQDLLSQLQTQLCNPSPGFQTLLQSIHAISSISSASTNLNFRMYKFGSLNNRSYIELYNKQYFKYLQKLVYILKEGIEGIGRSLNKDKIEAEKHCGQNMICVLQLFEEVVSRLYKDMDIGAMKVRLDIALCNPPKLKQSKPIPKPTNISHETYVNSCPNYPKINSSTHQYSRQMSLFVRYDFQYQILNQEIYSLLYRLDVKPNKKQINGLLMEKMLQYSAQHSAWDKFAEEDAILMQFQGNNQNMHSSSFGLSSNSNPSISNLQPQSTTDPNINLSPTLLHSQPASTEPNLQPPSLCHYTSLLESEGDQPSTPTQKPSTRSRFCQQNDGILQDLDNDQIGDGMDGIIQNDDQDQNGSFRVVDELKQCMSQTSLNFLSQHEVKVMEEEEGDMLIRGGIYDKRCLLQLYEQSVVNPQARKQLLVAVANANVLELEKFIANQAVDQEMEMIIVRQLWSRGIVPSTTSISKCSRYYGNLISPTRTFGKCLNIHLSQAITYKKMHQKYSSSCQPDIPTIPILQPETLQTLFLLCSARQISQNRAEQTSASSLKSGQPQTSNKSTWKLLNILCLQPQNMFALIQICLSYLTRDDSAIMGRVKLMGIDVGNVGQLRMLIVDDVFAGCVKDRMGLKVLFSYFWDSSNFTICSNNKQCSLNNQQTLQLRPVIPILEFILKQSCLLDKTLSCHISTKSGSSTAQKQCQTFAKLPHELWKYFQNCDQFLAHSNLSKDNQTLYPYYQVQESLKLSDNIVKKIVDRLFNVKVVVGGHKNKDVTTPMEELLMVLIYLDPNCFESYFRTIVQKMSTKLMQIIRKQHKILTNFQSSWQQSSKNTHIQMQKQYKYWNLRECKKSTSQFQQTLEFFRNILVDISVNLLSKFKKMRFNYHCGKSYREAKLEIQILREKMLTYGSVEGLSELEMKERELEDWRRNQSNQIINQQILPIVQENSEQFMKVLIEAEDFVSQFLETFSLNQGKQKIVIFSNCAKIYEILLACDILTHQEKLTYHSMSKLKTTQSLQSCKNMANANRRKSSLANRKSARLSINPSLPKVQNLLRKIGPSCTYLNAYLGQEQAVRQLHAKYSDVNKRLKIMWANNVPYNPNNKPQKQKTIQCRRTHIIQDTLAQIDDDFINLPVKIKFEGQIGIDYGGVTRQWITLFMKQIINPDLGLFSLSANKLTFQPNPNSCLIPNHLRYFRKIGIIIGKAMKQNWLLEVNLAKSFLKHLLGTTLYIQDLEDIDPQTAKSLKWMLDNDIGYDDMLGLNFTYERQKVGRKETVQMIPGGAQIPVDEDNKKKYIKMLANIKMTQQIREQSKAFMSGLESVIPYSTLRLFSYKQISLYLSGMPTIDIKQMQQTARYENITPQSQQIVWFWTIISEWSQQELANFLFFLTGSYKVPYGGFKQHPIGFNKMPSCQDYLPVAHTCFSVIDISSYSNKQKMARLLKKSIKEGKGFSVS